MGKKLSHHEVADVIEDVLLDFDFTGSDLRDIAGAIFGALVIEGIIDDREVDI